MARFHLPYLFIIGKATWNQSKGYMSCSNSSLYTCLNTSAPAILSSQSFWYFQPKAVFGCQDRWMEPKWNVSPRLCVVMYWTK